MLVAVTMALGPTAALAQDRSTITGRQAYERVATVDDPPRVSLWASDSYRSRDSRSRVYFRTDAGAYVTVLAMSERGEVRVIHPRSPASTSLVRADQEMSVQVPGMGQYGESSYGERVYVLAIASPVPFDFSEYTRGRSWRDTRLARIAHQDPETAIEDFANRTIPDPDVQYSYDILSLSDRGYDRYSSRSRGYGDCYGYAGYSDYSRHLFPAYGYANYVHVSAFHPWMFGLTSLGYGDCYGSPYRFVILVPPRQPTPAPARDTTRRAIPKWTAIGSGDGTRIPKYEPVKKLPPAQGTFPPGRGRRSEPATLEGNDAQQSEDRRAVHTGTARREPDRAVIVPGHEPRQSEPTRPEPKYEPVRSEPVRSEPTRSEPTRGEPARSEPKRSEPARSEPKRSEPARSANWKAAISPRGLTRIRRRIFCKMFWLRRVPSAPGASPLKCKTMAHQPSGFLIAI